MRIAILMLNRGRGSGEVARAHAERLAAAGHDVTMVLPGPDDMPEGVKHVSVELPTSVTPVTTMS